MTLGQHTLCFANVHLSAHEHNEELRHKEYKAITQKLRFAAVPEETLLSHEYVWVFLSPMICECLCVSQVRS